MSRRPMATVALAAVLLLAGCSVGFQPADDGGLPTLPGDDDLGTYDGYSHDESLDVDETDGLNESEQEAVFARAMARVQVSRNLQFSEDVDIELVTRETFREEYGDVTGPQPPDDVRTLDNAQYEALFLVGGDEDVVSVRQGNRGDLVLGFYRPGAGQITLVSEQDPPTLPNEYTLAHELVHALQDQRFGLGSLGGGTMDRINAQRGLIEGGASLVEQEYRQRCASGEWECVGVRDEPVRPEPQPDFHYGVYFVDFFAYAEGPTFVEHHRDRGGWGAVDAMFDDPPETSAAVVHPETYGTDAYGPATVEDRTSADWERVRTDRGDHATVGQSGLVSMFAYTAYADRSKEGVVDVEAFENVGDDGRLDDRQPFSYDLSYADGWYGDRLHAYQNGDATAAVWNVTFQEEADATEFESGYEAVVEYWDGERTERRGDATVWRLEGETFDGAVWVQRDGNSVTVVKAPSVDALDDVYAPAGR